MRAPLVRSLAHHAAWWNPLWIETFDLETANRPEVCERALNAALPQLPWSPGPRWMHGYVWHGGFTIQRMTPWANGARAMGTGEIGTAGPTTRIRFRVALNRSAAYGLAAMTLLFYSGAALALVGMLSTRTVPLVSLMFVIFFLALSPAVAVTVARMPRRDRKRSEEADKLLTFLQDVISAQPES